MGMSERCLHNEVCKYGEKRSNGMYCTEEKCKQFKDRTRFVELPCCYAKTVWVIGDKKIVECEIDEISFGVVGLMYLVCFECDSDCEGCPFNTWSQGYSGEWSCDGEYGQAAVKGECFGKTVFLTREDAEKALTERKDNERKAD